MGEHYILSAFMTNSNITRTLITNIFGKTALDLMIKTQANKVIFIRTDESTTTDLEKVYPVQYELVDTSVGGAKVDWDMAKIIYKAKKLGEVYLGFITKISSIYFACSIITHILPVNGFYIHDVVSNSLYQYPNFEFKLTETQKRLLIEMAKVIHAQDPDLGVTSGYLMKKLDTSRAMLHHHLNALMKIGWIARGTKPEDSNRYFLYAHAYSMVCLMYRISEWEEQDSKEKQDRD